MIEPKPIRKEDSLKDYDRAYINTRPPYEQYCNSGAVEIPWYKKEEVKE